MKKFFREFKEFAMRGNVLDMAIGVVIGAAFGKITTSIVNDLIMPLISLITGGVDFSDWQWTLKEGVTLNYGNLISVILDFIIIAFAMFLVIKAMNAVQHIREKEQEVKEAIPEDPKPTTEELLAEIRDLLKEQK